MIRTMARVTDVHQLEDEEDGVELPSKIVNEDLRRFFMPKKYAEPEPLPKALPEAEKVEERADEEPATGEAAEAQEAAPGAEPVQGAKETPVKEEAKSAAVPAAPVALLRKSEQHAQSPKSAYAPGAFDPRAPQAPATSPVKSSSKWWRMGSRKSRMGKDASPAKAAPAQPVRFLEKHNYTQPSAKQLLEGERPLQPIPGEAHAEADPATPEPADDAGLASNADKDGLVGEVTPAAVDSTAAAGDPIAEAVVALQEVMEPTPVPEPALDGEAVKGPETEEAVQAVHEGPHEATAHKNGDIAVEEVGPIEATAHKEEAQPVEAVAQSEKLSEAELAAPLDAIADKVLPEAAQPEEPSAHELPTAPAAEAVHKEGNAHDEAEPELLRAADQEPAAAEGAAAVEATETKAAERKAITMNMTLNEEIEAENAEHRPVSCNFVVDEDALPVTQLASIPETHPMSTQSSPQKEVPINDWYKGKAGKKGRGFFSCFGCFRA